MEKGFIKKSWQVPHDRQGHPYIMNDIQQAIHDTCRRFGVVTLYAFGSRGMEVYDLVQGCGALDSTCRSDVDIGVKLQPSSFLSTREKVRLAMELEDILDVDRVDLCLVEEAGPFVAANIIRGEKLYCEDTYLADEYELYILRRAGDFAFLERERQRIIFGEAQETGD
jgi:predicted nucleotidyltransferase